MTWAWDGTSGHEPGEFARARVRAELDAMVLRGKAIRTVAGHAVDHEDFRRLLLMLGLDDETGG
jgi:hypothetical protein